MNIDMKPYDPKLNPNKSLEETIENFIAWIRTSNRGTASVLKSVSDKLLDISTLEENLKTLETSQLEAMSQISELLTKVTEISNVDQNQSEPTDFQDQVKNSLAHINNQVKQQTESIAKIQDELLSEFTQSMNKIEGSILDIKSDIVTINTQLKITRNEPKPSSFGEKTVQDELTKIREKIVCKSEQDKATIVQILDDLIIHLGQEIIEISGIELKQELIKARTLVYEKTEGLAPRFRKMMDNLTEVINDETLYSSASLELILVEGLRYIREIYHSAPVGHHD